MVPEGTPHRGTLLVLAGTSGAGKGTVGARLRAAEPGLGWSVSWTTRARRPGEVPDVDYHYVTRAEFEALLQFLRVALVPPRVEGPQVPHQLADPHPAGELTTGLQWPWFDADLLLEIRQ